MMHASKLSLLIKKKSAFIFLKLKKPDIFTNLRTQFSDEKSQSVGGRYSNNFLTTALCNRPFAELDALSNNQTTQELYQIQQNLTGNF